MLGFLRWTFKDCFKSAQFYAFGLVLVAVLAKLAGCPAPVPWYIMLIGGVISVADAVVWAVKFQYFLYKREQDRIARELSRK